MCILLYPSLLCFSWLRHTFSPTQHMIHNRLRLYVQLVPSLAPKKDCNFDTKLQSFLTKSAFVGINPLSWMKSLRDEILLRKVKGGGFNFIWSRRLKISSEHREDFIVQRTISLKMQGYALICLLYRNFTQARDKLAWDFFICLCSYTSLYTILCSYSNQIPSLYHSIVLLFHGILYS